MLPEGYRPLLKGEPLLKGDQQLGIYSREWVDAVGGIITRLGPMHEWSRTRRPLPFPPLCWDSPDDVPPLCWLRSNDTPDRQFLVVQVTGTGVGTSRFWSWERLAEFGMQYSTDRKTFVPCHKQP